MCSNVTNIASQARGVSYMGVVAFSASCGSILVRVVPFHMPMYMSRSYLASIIICTVSIGGIAGSEV